MEEELQKEKETMASQSFLLRQDIAKELSTVQEQASKLRENINVMEQVLSIIKIFYERMHSINTKVEILL